MVDERNRLGCERRVFVWPRIMSAVGCAIAGLGDRSTPAIDPENVPSEECLLFKTGTGSDAGVASKDGYDATAAGRGPSATFDRPTSSMTAFRQDIIRQALAHETARANRNNVLCASKAVVTDT